MYYHIQAQEGETPEERATIRATDKKFSRDIYTYATYLANGYEKLKKMKIEHAKLLKEK